MNGAQGSVLFPSDGSASYATVTADGQSMAMVSVDSGCNGVTAGSGERVVITPAQAGKVTLTITYYAAAPEEGMAEADSDLCFSADDSDGVCFCTTFLAGNI